MQTRNNAKRILKILSWVFHTSLLLCTLFFMWFAHIIAYSDFYLMDSAYIMDFSNVVFFKIIWAFFVIANISIAAIARFYNKMFSVVHFLLSQFGIVYFCWLLTL